MFEYLFGVVFVGLVVVHEEDLVGVFWIIVWVI